MTNNIKKIIDRSIPFYNKSKNYLVSWYRGKTKNKNITYLFAILFIFYVGKSCSMRDNEPKTKIQSQTNISEPSIKEEKHYPSIKIDSSRKKQLSPVVKGSSKNTCWLMGRGLSPYTAYSNSLTSEGIVLGFQGGGAMPDLMTINSFESTENLVVSLKPISEKESTWIMINSIKRSMKDCPYNFTPSEMEDIEKELRELK